MQPPLRHFAARTLAPPYSQIANPGRSNSFDRAAKRLGLGLSNRLGGEELIQRVLQIWRGDFGGVLVVLVDPPMVTKRAPRVDDVDLWGVARVVQVRDLVVRVLH